MLVVPFIDVAMACANALAAKSAPQGAMWVWSLVKIQSTVVAPAHMNARSTALKWSTYVTLGLLSAWAATRWYSTKRGGP